MLARQPPWLTSSVSCPDKVLLRNISLILESSDLEDSSNRVEETAREIFDLAMEGRPVAQTFVGKQ